MNSLQKKVLKNKRDNKIKNKKNDDSTINEKIKNSENNIDVSVNMATKMWNDIKKRVRDDPSFEEMPDADKIALYQNSDYKIFYTEFPIVSRYMICMGQFSVNALKKYLLKCKNVIHDPIKSKEKGYTEDQWVQRQADYVRYLWEAYQKTHFNKTESNEIWQNTYKILKKEFQDFKDLHKEIEDKIEKDKVINKEEMVKELLSRLANNEQSLDDETTKNLIENLKQKVIEQQKKSII
jgi:hypothetical protein